MSQARKIHSYLSQTDNKAADKVLSLALNRAEQPYSTALLETIVDAGRAAGTQELVNSYHRYDQEWQHILTDRVVSLHTGLRQCGRASSTQSRLNTLAIIREGSYCRLTDLVGTLLRDRDSRVADCAGETLLTLAQRFSRDWPLPRQAHGQEKAWTMKPVVDDNKELADQRAFIAGLSMAVRNYSLHERNEALLAAMQIVSADWEAFWGNILGPYHAVGKSVRDLMGRCDRPEFASFYLTAMRVPWLRSTAVRVVSAANRADFVIALARTFQTHKDDKQIRDALRGVERPQWLNTETMNPTMFAVDEQIALAELVVALGVQPSQVLDFLRELAEMGQEQVGPVVASKLADLPVPVDSPPVARALVSPHEEVALAILTNLVKRNPPQLHRILVRQLSSPHKRLSELSRSYLQRTAFKRYWQRFDGLSTAQRVSAGRAVFKIDPHAHQRWMECVSEPLAQDRLRAIRIAKVLNRSEMCAAALIRLANDSDGVVRSYAVAVLGEVSGESREEVERCLLKSLDDKDSRVQANAIDSLLKLGVRSASGRIARLTGNQHSRVRANAIRAQLNWKVDSARKAIQTMACDRRMQHRRSAAWVIHSVENSEGKTQEYKGTAENTENREKSITESHSDTVLAN